MKRIVTLSLAISLVAAACGGDDSGDTTTTTEPVPVESTTTTTAPATTTTTAAPTTTTTLPADPKISAEDTVTTGGLGPVRIGMNPQEANVAVGYGLAVDQFISGNCYYLSPEPVLEDVGFMVNNGTIARVDIYSGSDVTTRSGARVGMTEQQILDLFGEKIQEAPHEYITGGKYLIFVPVDERDKNFRVVFETDANGIVVTYRAGRVPEVLWIEGCA